MKPRIGELFAGYGGLGMGVQAVIGGEIAWFSEFDAAPSKILAHNFPGIPNHGDITKIDWSTVEPVDVLTGGFPCQDVSLAGARKGLMEGTRSGLWSEFAKAIDALRPGLVVIENVRGLLSAKTVEEVDEEAGDLEPESGGVGELGRGDRPVLNAFGRVLGDLAELGYDAEWVGVRAADAGAPHGRYRVFIVAQDTNLAAGDKWRLATPGQAEGGWARPDAGRRSGAPTADAGCDGCGGDEECNSEPQQPELEASRRVHADGCSVADADRIGSERWRDDGDVAGSSGTGEADREQWQRNGDAADDRKPVDWREYGPAIARWEAVMMRAAPSPTKADGKGGNHRLSSDFCEWMMGLPAGHVTNPAIGITRNEQLKALGNGVVWQQAALAVGTLLARTNSHERIAA
ncbi:MAG: DNA (cytosine-5-)-methyltransferase [Kineosporiaceae bacterium]|nr:DNA (cytosine-5-)-methyltransferase [Aeromicrobium sp.]